MNVPIASSNLSVDSLGMILHYLQTVILLTPDSKTEPLTSSAINSFTQQIIEFLLFARQEARL